jgi:tetratricopeptide (TPR) repeat protein
MAIRLDPKEATAYNNRGSCYGAKGAYDKAIADFSEAIRLDPKYARAYSNRAQAYRALGDEAHAANDERAAQEVSK